MKTFLKARWEDLVMKDYAVPPSLLEKRLPKGVEPDHLKNETSVSLAGFRFLECGKFNCPIPYSVRSMD